MNYILILLFTVTTCVSADNPFLGKWKWVESKSTDGTILTPDIEVIYTITDKNIIGKSPILGDTNNSYEIIRKNGNGFLVSVFYTKEKSNAKETWVISNGIMTQKDEEGALLVYSFISK